MKDEIKLPPPKDAAVGRCLPRRAEARRGAANASCRMYCRESSRAISWPTKPGNGKQLDHLVLVPHGKLATLRFQVEAQSRHFAVWHQDHGVELLPVAPVAIHASRRRRLRHGVHEEVMLRLLSTRYAG